MFHHRRKQLWRLQFSFLRRAFDYEQPETVELDRAVEVSWYTTVQMPVSELFSIGCIITRRKKVRHFEPVIIVVLAAVAGLDRISSVEPIMYEIILSPGRKVPNTKFSRCFLLISFCSNPPIHRNSVSHIGRGASFNRNEALYSPLLPPTESSTS